MNKDTVVTYTSNGKTITLSASQQSDIWVTSMDGASSNTTELSESQAVDQIGSTLNNLAVKPKDITVNGAVIRNIEANRKTILGCIFPGTTGRLTVRQNGESWYIDGAPKTTPIFTDGSHAQTFQFVMHCPYPYWKSSMSGKTQVFGVQALFQFPTSLAGQWYISKTNESMFSNVLNTGSSPIGFELVFSAVTAVTNPEIIQVETGAKIHINKVLQAGESIMISTIYGRRGAVLTHADGTTENAFRFLSIDSDLAMAMQPGNNTLRADAEINREGLRAVIIMPAGEVPGL